MQPTFRERVTIEYNEPVLEQSEDGRYTRTVGHVRMQCEVDVIIDLRDIARYLGARACKSKTGRSKDGYVAVYRVGKPVELSRKLDHPVEEQP